jgi:hypothetical protein
MERTVKITRRQLRKLISESMNKADRFSKYFEHAKVALPNVIKRIEKHMAEWLSGALSEKRMRSQFGGDESFRPRYDTPDWILKQWLDHPSGGKFFNFAFGRSHPGSGNGRPPPGEEMNWIFHPEVYFTDHDTTDTIQHYVRELEEFIQFRNHIIKYIDFFFILKKFYDDNRAPNIHFIGDQRGKIELINPTERNKELEKLYNLAKNDGEAFLQAFDIYDLVFNDEDEL